VARPLASGKRANYGIDAPKRSDHAGGAAQMRDVKRAGPNFTFVIPSFILTAMKQE